jgi:hypothetical protein
MTGTFVNVGAILLGTLVGELVGGRLSAGLQARIIHGLGSSCWSSASTTRWPGGTPTCSSFPAAC